MVETAHQEEDILQCRDPLIPDLRVVYWTRTGRFKKDNANLLFWCHGIGEHTGRHHQLASLLLSQTPSLDAIISFDQRGHGKSGGHRGCATSIEELADDAFNIVLPRAALQYGIDPRVILGGHSMGGAVVAAIATRPDSLKQEACGTVVAVVLSAPALKVPVPSGINRVLSPFLSVIASIPGIKGITKSTGINADHLSHDSDAVKNYREDPLVHDRLNASLGYDLMRWGDEIVKRVSAPAANDTEPDIIFRSEGVPTLIMQGAEDLIVDCEGSRALRDALQKHAKAPVKYVEFEKAYHEIHQETDDRGSKLFVDTMSEFLQDVFSKL